jgi:hypothetical protein
MDYSLKRSKSCNHQWKEDYYFSAAKYKTCSLCGLTYEEWEEEEKKTRKEFEKSLGDCFIDESDLIFKN